MKLKAEPVLTCIVMIVVATAYCTCSHCTAPYDDGYLPDGVTEPVEGRTIAGPPEWELGTIVYIPDRGVHIVEDRGGAIKGNRIDIYFDSHEDALEFGRQTLRICILLWGD